MQTAKWMSAGLATLAFSICCYAAASTPGTILEFAIPYPYPDGSRPSIGSTHEIASDPNERNALWVTGQNYDTLVRVATDGSMDLFTMPPGSGPHGIDFDAAGRLWITLEFTGKIARLDDLGNILQQFDVSLNCSTCPVPINTHPHGLAIARDGKTVWFTGKATGTVGKIMPDGKIQTYALPSVGSVPIYIKGGPDGSMWVTELVGNTIARVRPDGAVREFPIPTYNSRPIAIVPEPGGKAMWFTEEAGNKIGRIDRDGKITEYPVPKFQENVILAGLAFDADRNLWVQQYVDEHNPLPDGPDHVIKIDRAILHTEPSDFPEVPITFYQVPTRETIMHRIISGPDGNMWFTELRTDKVGKVIVK